MRDDTRFLIISGLSGAGKSVALNALEDAGFYCVDNLPVGILPGFATYLSEHDLPHFRQVAVGIDARNHPQAIAALPATLDALAGQGIHAELIFVDADDETLLARFSETRRRHPLSAANVSLTAAIEQERALLDPIIMRADLRIDTTRTNVHELRSLVREQISGRESHALALQFRSFGFKKGVPGDADFVFDVRCLPNPYWDASLRDLSGRDDAVIAFLDREPLVGELVSDVTAYLQRWIPRFQSVNRSYLTVAFGCTGGRHRSVYVTERVARHFDDNGMHTGVSHRDL